MFFIKYKKFPELNKYNKFIEAKMNKNDYFLRRKSKRKFSDKNIPESLLRTIIERAAKAPSCGNMQLYSVIITRDKEKKKLISKFHYDQPAALTSNVILTICADFNRFSRWCNLKGANPGYDNFHSFIMALTDSIIFSQQIVTIAEMEGLGTCFLGTVNYNASMISNLLQLPDLVIPVASIALGYSGEEGKETERLPVESIIHEEIYRKDNDEEIIDFFKIKEEFPSNVKYVEENKCENLAHLFTDIRYPKKLNEEVSDSFMNLLKEKKFID